MNFIKTVERSFVAALLLFFSGCGPRRYVETEGERLAGTRKATLQPRGEYTTPAGKPVKAYVVSIDEGGENLLLVVGAAKEVEMADAATVKIGGQPIQRKLSWACVSRSVVAVSSDGAILDDSLIADKIGSAAADGDKFPMPLFMKFVSGNKLNLPELDASAPVQSQKNNGPEKP